MSRPKVAKPTWGRPDRTPKRLPNPVLRQLLPAEPCDRFRGWPVALLNAGERACAAGAPLNTRKNRRLSGTEPIGCSAAEVTEVGTHCNHKGLFRRMKDRLLWLDLTQRR